MRDFYLVILEISEKMCRALHRYRISPIGPKDFNIEEDLKNETQWEGGEWEGSYRVLEYS